MSQITDFFALKKPDANGRMLFHVIGLQDSQIENSHDLIPWLFPTREKSKFNPDMPTLTEEDITQFKSNPELQNNLRLAYSRFLLFLGLQSENNKVVKGENFHERYSDVWSYWNHNFIRITRAISSLRTLGLMAESWALYEGVLDVCSSEPVSITESTKAFWMAAVTGNKMPEFERE